MKGEKANLNICFISCIKPNSYKTRNQKTCYWLLKGHQLHIKRTAIRPQLECY